ncbi:hypothetical protein GQ457_11G004510 [Hibiscus cannabinus]
MPTMYEIVEKKDETTYGLKDLVKEKAKYSMVEAVDIPKALKKASTVCSDCYLVEIIRKMALTENQHEI